MTARFVPESANRKDWPRLVANAINYLLRNAALAIESTSNSSLVPLGAGATFTGAGEKNDLSEVMASVKTDAAGTLYFDFSNDGTNWDSTFPPDGFRIEAGIHEFHVAEKGPRYFRVRMVNGADAQTYLRLFIYYGHFEQGNLPLNARIAQDSDSRVVRIKSEEEIMTGKVAGDHIVQKYGRNGDVDAAADIWNGGGDYTGFPTSAAENFEVFSSDASDTSAGTGARQVRVYYLDDDYNMFDANGDFLYFDVTLNGTTGVDSGVSGMRVWRAKVISSGSGKTNAGGITVRWISTTSVVFAVLPVGFGQTELGNFTIPAGYTGYLKRYSAEMDDSPANSAQMAIKTRDFGSNTERLIRPFAISTEKSANFDLYGGERFNEKTDFCFRCTSITNANGVITVSYAVRLEKNL